MDNAKLLSEMMKEIAKEKTAELPDNGSDPKEPVEANISESEQTQRELDATQFFGRREKR